jgi:hypothetical protein
MALKMKNVNCFDFSDKNTFGQEKAGIAKQEFATLTFAIVD